MARGVIALDSISVCAIDYGSYGVAYTQNTLGKMTNVNINSVRLFDVRNVYEKTACRDGSGISYLSAALAVEGSTIENKAEIALAYLINGLFVGDNGKNLCV